MAAGYTAVVQQHGEWWIGWVEEVPGVNSQGRSREELLENLRDALEEALEMNRADARAAACGVYEERSEDHTSELQSRQYLVCRLLLEKKKRKKVIEAIRNRTRM